MKKHYLVLVHDQPDHVLRLISRLDDGESTCWIHLDARVPESDWAEVAAHPSVRMVQPRVACVWGTWSLVEATLAALRACLSAGSEGYLVMLSGQSYPLRSTTEIDRYLAANADRIHLDLWPLEERWPDNYRDRLDYFCIPMSDTKGDLRLLRPRQQMNARELFGWTRRLVREVGVRRTAGVLRTIRSERPDVAARIEGGSQWWAMSWDVARDLLQFHDAHPEYADFMRWSQYPDESFFQTLLVNLDGALRQRVAPTLTYVDWTEGDWDLPRTFGADDVPDLLALPDHYLFARKFAGSRSADALDRLDEGHA